VTETFDVAVIGGGAAGLSAAMSLADRDFHVVLVDRLGGGGELLNFTSFRDDGSLGIGAVGPVIGGEMIAAAIGSGVEFVFDEITNLAPRDGHHVLTHGSGTVEALASVIATGRVRRVPPLEGAIDLIGRGISFCGACDAPLYVNQNVAVVGTDDLAAYEALEVAQHVGTVSLVLPSPSSIASNKVRNLVNADERIEFVFGTPKSVETSDGAVAALFVDSEVGEHRLAVRGIFSCYAAPDSDWCAKEVARTPDGRIVVDAELRATQERIYAVGEVRLGSGDSALSAIADGRCVAQAVTNDLKTSQLRS
jgi:thioredoxin reductase (NADPH)